MNFNFSENPSENIDIKEIFSLDSVTPKNHQYFNTYE